MQDNTYDFVLRFDMNVHSKVEVNALLNKVRSLLFKEGFKFEQPTETDKNQYQKKAQS